MVAVPRRVGLYIAGLLPVLAMASCGPSQAPAATDDAGVDAGPPAMPDSGPPHTSGFDANDFLPPSDAGKEDAGREDAGAEDAGHEDAGLHDAGASEDAGKSDAGHENDAGEEDAGVPDAGGTGRDAGHGDAGCVPWTDQFICQNRGRKCGSYSITDNCGGPRDETCFNACPSMLAAGDFLLDGVTTDGNVVVTDKTNGNVSVINPSFSPPTLATISSHGANPVVTVSNTEVFIWYVTSAANAAIPVGTLYTWDAADESKGPVDGGTMVAAALASPSDGELFYVSSVNESNSTGTLVGAGSDLTSPKSLLTGLYLPPLNENFGGVAAFTSYGIILAHRLSTSTNTTLTTWSASSSPLWASQDLGLQIAGPFAADSAGDVTWLGSPQDAGMGRSSGTLYEAPGAAHATAGTIATAVSSEVLGTENATAWISSQGTTVAYVSGGTVYAATQMPAFTPMGLDTGVAAVVGLDPGGDTVLYAKNLRASSSCSDLWVSSTASATPTQISAGTCALYGSLQFTQDGASLVYIDGPTNDSGTVTSFALTSANPPQSWGNGGATAITTVDNSVILFIDGVIPSTTPGIPSTVDIEQADVSTTNLATVAGLVDSSFVLTNATGSESLIYTVSSTTVRTSATKGLYIVALP